MTRFLLSIFLLLSSLTMVAQIDDYNQIDPNGNITRRDGMANDSTHENKEIPKGLKVWTVSERFGDIVPAIPDTLSHMYPIWEHHASTGCSLIANVLINSLSLRNLMTTSLLLRAIFISPIRCRPSPT